MYKMKVVSTEYITKVKPNLLGNSNFNKIYNNNR